MKEKGESDEALAATKRKAEEDIAAANDVHVKVESALPCIAHACLRHFIKLLT